MVKRVVLEGCLGDWSRKSYTKPLAERARKGKISLYAVDTRDITDEIELYDPVIFVNKKDTTIYNSIDDIDFVFIVTPHEFHCKIAKHWLEEGKLNENGRIFIEKPLDSSVENIEELGKCKDAEKKIIAIDHYIPKIIPLIKELEKRHETLGYITKIRFDILETDPILESRKKTLDEGLILDIFPHIMGVLTKVMNVYGEFGLDTNNFKILGVKRGKYQGAPINGETFAKITARIEGIPLESCIGKAVDSRDCKLMNILFEKGSLTADFSSRDFFIKTENEYVKGTLQKKHIGMLLDYIIDEEFDYDRILQFSLNFREGYEVVKIISRIGSCKSDSIEYEQFEPLESILINLEEFEKKNITDASRRNTDEI
jgi:predicted dehydrogenase